MTAPEYAQIVEEVLRLTRGDEADRRAYLILLRLQREHW